MAEFSGMTLWTDSYLGDTRHLSTIEHGAYLLLLITAWRTNDCALPNDDRQLARYAGLNLQQWNRMKATILPFFTVDGDQIYQKRQRGEREAVKQLRQSRSQAGQRGGIAKSLNKKEAPPSPATDLLEQKGGEALAPASAPAPKVEREDKSSPKKSTRWVKGAHFPDEWIEWAMKENRWAKGQAQREANRFVDWASANGKTYVSWEAAWRNWCRSPYQKNGSGQDQRALTL